MNLDFTNLTEEDALEMTARLLVQLDEARAAVELAQRRAIGVRKVIDGLVEMFPEAEDLLPDDIDGTDDARPRGAEAVRLVLKERRTWMNVMAVVLALSNYQWLPASSNPANAVRSALERLVERGLAEKARAEDGTVGYKIKEVPDDEPF